MGTTGTRRRKPAGDETGAGDTRAALLAAGRRAFAASGFEAASVRAITAEAGATLGAITYHFGSKEGLYEAVVASCVEPLVERVTQTAALPVPPLERAEAVVRAFMTHLLDNPDLPRLMLHQLLRTGRPPDAAARAIRRMLQRLAEVVAEGQAERTVRPGPPPLVAMALVSHPLHLAVVRPALQAVAGLDLSDADTRALALENAVRFAHHGLAAQPGDWEAER